MTSTLGIFHYLMYPWSPLSGNCVLCHRLVPGGNTVCQTCIGLKVIPHAQALEWAHPLEPNVKCRALFEWTPNLYSDLSAIFVSGKGTGSQGTWERMAELFFQFHGGPLFRQGKTVKIMYAVPGQTPQRKHAEVFAMALARRSGVADNDQKRLVRSAPISDSRGDSREQKNRTRKERLAYLNSHHGPLLPSRTSDCGYPDSENQMTVIVDDILTTGSTTKRILDAIPRSQYTEVWVLAHRGLLARPSPFC